MSESQTIENFSRSVDEVLRQRLDEMEDKRKKQFRYGYVFKRGVDFSLLEPYCEHVIIATDGIADPLDKARLKLELSLRDYDPSRDLIVIYGRSMDNLLAGMIVVQKVLEKPKAYQSYAVAVFYDSYYRFFEVFLDPTIESHEIYTK